MIDMQILFHISIFLSFVHRAALEWSTRLVIGRKVRVLSSSCWSVENYSLILGFSLASDHKYNPPIAVILDEKVISSLPYEFCFFDTLPHS